MEKATEFLAQFLAETDFGDLPAEAISHARLCMLDFLGVALGGSTMKRSRILADFVQDLGGAEEATVIGYPFKVPCPSAGLVNGAVGHALQMDDTEWASIAHIGTTAIPAALALAEKRGADGKELVTAIVLGYEGAIRIGAAINPSHNRRGFSPNGTVGVFAAAIAAAKILHLNKDQMADAIGSAAMQASGLEEFCHDGSMGSILNTGHAAQAGIISALLAQRGFTGSHAILEGRKGFCRAYSDSYDISTIIGQLGQEYRMLDVWFKRYPTCAYANASLDVILELVDRHNIQVSDVEEVRIKTYAVVEDTINNPDPSNTTAAMLSLPYSAAVALVDRQVTPQQFTEEKLKDEKIHDAMGKVRLIVADEELCRFAPVIGLGASVEIICQDGRRYEGRVNAPRGETRNAFTEEELFEKFESLALNAVDIDTVNDIAKTVKRLEDIDDIRTLTSLLCPFDSQSD